jgi:hypothetical protein
VRKKYTKSTHKDWTSVADPGRFIPDPDPTIFSSRILIQTFFHPGSYMKNGMHTYLFLASHASLIEEWK